MRSIVYLMKQCKLDKLALTETHMKQQGQYVIKGYTFSRAAHEVLDEKNTAQQTFTGVSLVTAPHITLAVVDPTMYNGRLLSFTLDSAEIPITIYVVYAHRNMKDQSEG